jgi:SSS family transporter
VSVPALDRPWIVAAALAYLAVVLAVGAWSWRRTRGARDFYIAGQGLGVVVTGLATMSAAFSGFVFLGGPGLTYRIGLGSLMIVAPVGFTAAMLCWVLGKRLRLLAGVREIYTVPDAVRARYGSRLATGLAAVAVVVGVVGYLGAQLLALGRAFEAVFGTREALGEWSLAAATAVGLAIVLAYSIAGGMVAGAWTDLIQGVLMVVAAAAVFIGALAAGGGWGRITESIAASERFGPAFLDPLGTVPALTAFGFVFVFGVGVLGQPHMLHKLYMLRDPRQLRWLPLVLGGSQSVCLLLWLGVGLAVPALVAQGRMAPLANPDDATPAFVLGFLPEALAGLVIAALLAAIMSTADSLLNLGAAALARDLPRALRRGGEEEPVRYDELAAGRWATLVVALAAAVCALLYDDLIALLGTFAFGTFAAALTPALAVGLNWKRVPAVAASASIATGLVLNLGLELLARQGALPGLRLPFAAGALPSAVALAGSFTVLFAVTGWHIVSRRPAPRLDPDVAAVMEA